jgi:ribonuclease-3 family protein
MLTPELSADALLRVETLALAHAGDAVYDLAVRTYLCARGVATVRKLHRETVRRVSAAAQAARAEALLPRLTEPETAVYLRGRNTAVNTVPKTATREEYAAATGLEALLGWLYLSGRRERLEELLEVLVDG